MEKMQSKLYIKTEAIVKYLLGMSDELDTFIMCEGENHNLLTTDQSLYEALASIEDKSKISYPKLVKFLEVVNINSLKEWKNVDRKILTPGRAEEIMKLANAKRNLEEKTNNKTNETKTKNAKDANVGEKNE